MIGDVRIDPAIIQYKDLSEEEVRDIFFITILISILVAIGFVLFSYHLSLFYNESIYIRLGKILSIGILFNILNIVPNALLLKEKKFKLLGIRAVIINIASGILTIILAINGAKYYALIANNIFISFFYICTKFL